MKEKPTTVVVPIEDWEAYQELKKKKETAEFFIETHKDLLIEYFNKLVR